MKKKRSRPLLVQPLESRRLLAAVDIPDNLTGDASALVAAPVNIDDSAGVRGAEIRLSYDTDLLDLDPDDITAGTVWNGLDTQIAVNVNDAAGTVTIFISASAALPTGSGSLILLSFAIADSAEVGDTAILNLTEVRLNEGQIPVAPAPTPGSDATDGLITVTAGDRVIGGYVYADTNTNNTRELVEGIPGVVITLTNVATGATEQTTTDATGRYEFKDLSPATYRVDEVQPIAYLEGGVNQLSVTIGANQTVADQNFRELGLLPQFLYNRLHTTLVQPVGSTAWTDTILRINVDASNNAAGDSTSPSADAAPDAASFGAMTTAMEGLSTATGGSSTSEGDSESRTAASDSAPAGEPIAVLQSQSGAVPLASNDTQPHVTSTASNHRKMDDDAVARDRALASIRIW